MGLKMPIFYYGKDCDFEKNSLKRVQGFPGGSAGKKSACSAETWVWSLGWEDPLEKGTAAHSSILACTVPSTVYCIGSDRMEQLLLSQESCQHFLKIHFEAILLATQKINVLWYKKDIS